MNSVSQIASSMDIAILSVLVMCIITFMLRAFPVLVPRKVLESRYLKTLNIAFPISVMTLLILASMEVKPHDPQWVKFFAQSIALGLVFLSYHFIKNAFLSIIIGVGSLNGILYCFGAL